MYMYIYIKFIHVALHHIMPSLLDVSYLQIGCLEEITFSDKAAFVHIIF